MQSAIREELSSLSFEELEALKQKIGTKEWNEALFDGPSSSSDQATSGSKGGQLGSRGNKNRPRELSSKIKVGKIREDVPVTRKQHRDPRFENLCGDFDEKIWSKNYEFLTDIQKTERETLKKKLKIEKDQIKRVEIKKSLTRMENKARSDAAKKEQEAKKKQERAENLKRLKEGKKPFFMKKSTQKIVELSDKYDQLKSSGKLDAYLKKKRSKNAGRDKKNLPIDMHK